MKGFDPCGCFPTGKHYPGIAHLLRIQAIGIAREFAAEAPWADLPVAFIDTETTGREPARDRIVEIGVVIGKNFEVISRHSWLIDPETPIPKEASEVHGIHDADVAGKPTFAKVFPDLLALLEEKLPAAYNAEFDRAFFQHELGRLSERPPSLPPAFRSDVEWVDPLTFAREIYRDEQSRALGDMAKLLGIELETAHRATDDAEAALRVLFALGKDARIPATYAALLQEQRRLARMFEEARRFWKKN